MRSFPEVVGTDRRTDRSGRTQYSAERADEAYSTASALAERRPRRPLGPRPALISHPTLTYCLARRSQRNPDPSHFFAPGVGDSRAADRDGLFVLRGFVGGDGWHNGAVDGGLRPDRPCCNNAVPDRCADRSRTRRGIDCRGKPADGEQPRPDTPSASPGGTGQRRPIMAG